MIDYHCVTYFCLDHFLLKSLKTFFDNLSIKPGEIEVLDLSEEVLVDVVQVLDLVARQVKLNQLRKVNVIR